MTANQYFVSRFLVLTIIKVAQCKTTYDLVNMQAESGVRESSVPESTTRLLNQLFWEKTSQSSVSNSDDHLHTSAQNTQSDFECCLNGGICVLNTFCHCRRGFFGRRCEFRRRKRSCGPVAHGNIFSDDCNFCQCFDGVLTCVPTKINCDNAANSEEERPQVFNLRKHNKRHKRKHKSKLEFSTTTLHPLLIKVLDSGCAVTSTSYQGTFTMLLTLLSVFAY